jgi:hypothetical protein
MTTPEGFSKEDQQRLAALEERVMTHLQNSPSKTYEFDPRAVGGVLSDEVKAEAIARLRNRGWIVSELNAEGGFTVTRA